MHLLLILMTGIPLDMIQTEEPKAIRLLFKNSTSYCFEQYPQYQQYQHQQVTISTVPQSGKAREQVTVA